MNIPVALKSFLAWSGIRRDRQPFLRASVTFLMAGALWILVSDLVESMLQPNASVLSAIEIGKDWLFVLVAAGTIALLELRNTRNLMERQRLQARSLERERRFRLITENSRDLISLCDKDGNYVYFSPSFTHVLGYTPEELLRTRFGDLLHPEDRDVFADSTHVALAEYRKRGANGQWIWLEGRRTMVDWKDRSYIVDIARDITERKNLERQVAEHTRHLERLSKHLVEVQEMERRHLARELHDEIGQRLTAVKIALESVRRDERRTATVEQLEDSIASVDALLDRVRSLSLDLRPAMLDALGLAPALRTYVDQHARRAGLSHEFIAGAIERRYVEVVEIACFRVAQEALNNVVKHAGARHVRVELACADGMLDLAVVDDGRGFDVEERSRSAAGGASFGLLGMRERVALIGGRFEMISRIGTGTEVRARFPLAPEPSNGRLNGVLQ